MRPVTATFKLMEAQSQEHTDLLPLGKGYRHPLHFLETWANRAQDELGPGFSLATSLRRTAHLLPPGYLPHILGNAPDCLISGCSVAENPQSLVNFLLSYGIAHPSIHVIDLIAVGKIWNANRPIRYHVADAGSLRSLFADESFDLIVQDHLLNCTPIAEYDSILAEMSRVLRPNGLIFLNYTDSRSLSKRLPASLAHCKLLGSGSGFLAVTEPWGNCESFIPFRDFQMKLAQSSLVIQRRRGIDIVDPNGLPCHRNYCIVTRR